MHFTVIVAGMNEPSNSNYLADQFIEGITSTSQKPTVDKFRLRDIDLHHFTLKDYAAQAQIEPEFAKIQASILKANGLLIATPIWNFSVPAHLKNLIDRIGAFGLDEETRSIGMLKGKPLYLIFTGGGGVGSWAGLMRRTTSHVSVGLSYFNITTVGTYFEPKCMAGKGVFQFVVDKRPDSIKKIQQEALGFAKVVKTYANTGSLPLRAGLWQRAFNFGQKVLTKLGITP